MLAPAPGTRPAFVCLPRGRLKQCRCRGKTPEQMLASAYLPRCTTMVEMSYTPPWTVIPAGYPWRGNLPAEGLQPGHSWGQLECL